MSRTLISYVVRLYVGLFLAALAGVVIVFLAVDYGDQQRTLAGLSTSELGRLYAYRAVMALQQLAPAAMLLSAGATFALIRRRGEWVAMQAVGISRLQASVPVAAASIVIALGLVAFDDQLVTRATTAANALRPAAWQMVGPRGKDAEQPRWFRLGQTILELRGGLSEGAFSDATVYELTPEFRLRRRVDAQRLKQTGGAWLAEGVVVREYAGDEPVAVRNLDALPLSLDARAADAFSISGRRPEELRLVDLAEQQRLRATLGLPSQSLQLAEHLRFSYPLSGVAAAALAIMLALRPTRKGQLTTVLVDGVAVSFLLVVLLAVGRTLVLNGRAAAWFAAWAPVMGLTFAALVLWQHDEGWRRRAR